MNKTSSTIIYRHRHYKIPNMRKTVIGHDCNYKHMMTNTIQSLTNGEQLINHRQASSNNHSEINGCITFALDSTQMCHPHLGRRWLCLTNTFDSFHSVYKMAWMATNNWTRRCDKCGLMARKPKWSNCRYIAYST